LSQVWAKDRERLHNATNIDAPGAIQVDLCFIS
jgi:hypothetical protein